MASLAACGGEDVAGERPRVEDAPGAAAVAAADPDALRPRETANPELTSAERRLLLRARGREWRKVTTGELGSFFGDDHAAPHVLYVWGEEEGGEGLRAFQAAVTAYAPAGTKAAVLLQDQTVSEDALVSLRSSQIPYPAYHSSPGGELMGQRLASGKALVTVGSAGVPVARTLPLSGLAGAWGN